MLTSLSLIFLVGLVMGAICQKLKLPRIIGMLVTGIVLGPYILDFLDPSILSISADLRKMALIIILIKAGLSLDLKDLKKAGRSAILMSFVPASCEITGYVLLAPVILGINHAEAAVMGAVLAAVSPAVVVPRMVMLIEKRYGTDKAIPQMILSGASCDDIFVIVLFTTFLNVAQGGRANVMDFVNIPVSIILGIILGIVTGLGLYLFFETSYARRHTVRNSMKVIIVLGFSFLLIAIEGWLEGKVSVSGLLAVVAMACTLKFKCVPDVSARLSEKFGKLWLAAEVILFVLVGAAVDIRYTLKAGLPALLMILAALVFRAAGVLFCTIKTNLTWKERLFCVIAYLPKATVQAAIGSVPLAAGLPCGQIVLSVAVLAIIVTAPLGAIGIDCTYKRLLTEFHLKQDEVAERVSKSRTAVTNSMRLLKLCDEVQKMVVDDMISTGHARALISIEDPEEQYLIAQKIFDEKLSVREVEKLVKDLHKPPKPPKEENKTLQAIYQEISERLKQSLSTKVSVSAKQNGAGKIEIEFYNHEDLERLLERITG